MEGIVREELGRIGVKYFSLSPSSLSVQLDPVPAGLHGFLSDYFFATLSDNEGGGGEEKKLFVKTPPQSDPTKMQLLSWVESNGMTPFATEVAMYTEVTKYGRWIGGLLFKFDGLAD